MRAALQEDRFGDALLLTVALIALFVEIAVLLGEMRLIHLPFWSGDESATPVIGLVVNKSHSVNTRSYSSLTWYPMVNGDKIHLEDTVMTGDNSTALIHLSRDEEILLEPHTLVRFTVDKGAMTQALFDFELAQGTIKVKSQRSRRLRVRVPSREVELMPESEAVLTAAPLSTLSDVRVNKGQAVLENTPSGAATPGPGAVEPVVITSGEAARLSPGRGLARLDTHLSIVPRSPQASGRVQADGPLSDVHFEWEGAQGDTVEWDANADFSSASSVRAQGGEALAHLPPGRYFWRVRQSVALSDPQQFTLVPHPSYHLLTPEPGATVTSRRPVSFSWEPITDAKEYLIQIAQRRDFEKVLRYATVGETQKAFDRLKPGKYYWRVVVTHREWGRLIASEPASFVVSKKRAAPPRPKGVKVLPAKGKKVKPEEGCQPSRWPERLARVLRRISEWWEPSALAADRETKTAAQAATVWMEFEWEPSPDAQLYRLEISTDREFAHIIARTDVRGTSAILELAAETRFYWRLASIDEEGELGPYSVTQAMLRSRAVPKEQAERKIAEQKKGERAPASPGEPKAAVPSRSFFAPTEARFGYAVSFIDDTQYSPNYTLKQNGFPLMAFTGLLDLSAGGVPFEVRGWLEPLRAQPTGPARGDLRYLQWGTEVLLTDAFSLAGTRWMVGPRLAVEGDFARASDDTLQVTSPLVYSAEVGPRWKLAGSRHWFWSADTLLEAAPFGKRRGAGLVLRTAIGLPHYLDEFFPSFELSAHPMYRLGTEAGSHGWNFEVNAALSLSWSLAGAAL